MELDQQKKHTQQIFDRVAKGYDNPSTRFFPLCAARLVDTLKPLPGSRVLDIATGTGMVAVSLAKAVGSQGHVHGIDISSGMLDQAHENIQKMALTNVDLHEMDAENLEFRSDYFDTISCSYGLFFIPDMAAALKEWLRVLKPGGRLVFTCFETTAFEPMLSDFVERLVKFGVQLPDGPFGARRITSLDHCTELLTEAGFVDASAENIQLGYHLKDENEWWEVVANTAMQALFDMVPGDQQSLFRKQHLEFVAQQKSEDGLWMDVQTRFSSGTRR